MIVGIFRCLIDIRDSQAFKTTDMTKVMMRYAFALFNFERPL